MSIETWGMLPKSQSDSQTIDQAIAAAVTAHNASSTAHTGSGQSLYNHVNNAIIDHKAGSIPADKTSDISVALRTNFTTPSAFNANAVLGTFGFGVTQRTASASGSHAVMFTDACIDSIALNIAKNPLFQLTANIAQTTNQRWDIYYGENGASSTDLAFGFTTTNNTIKGFVLVGTTFTFSASWTLDTNDHIYRAFVDPVTHNLVFMVDGVQKGSIPASSYYTAALAQPLQAGLFMLDLWNTATGTKSVTYTDMILGTTPV